MSGPLPATAGADVRRARESTWMALLIITVGTAAAFFLDDEANPVAQGLFAVVAAFEVMIAAAWWWSERRRTRR